MFGETFTASIPDRPIVPAAGEGFYESLGLSFRGTLTTTVTLEAFLNLVFPLTFIANEPRVVMRGRDLFALHTAWYNDSPGFNEGATGTTDTVLGIRVPLWVVPGTKENLSYNLTRVAVTNLSLEVVSLSALFTTAPPPALAGRGRLDMREIPFTTPAATGPFQVTPRLPQFGKLLGLLIFGNTVPTNAATAATIQSLSVDIQNRTLFKGMWQDLQTAFQNNIDFTRADATALVKRQVLQNYGFIDFREEPVDLIANVVSVNVDAEVASDAGRIVPIIEIPQVP